MNTTVFDIVIYHMINYLGIDALIALININKLFVYLIKKNINNLKETLANEYFLRYCNDDNIILIKILLTHNKIDPSMNDNFAIRYASHNGHLSIVEKLLKDERVDPSADNNFAIQYASHNGHLSIVERLLKDERVDPSADNNLTVRLALVNCHLQVIDRLLKDERVKNTLSEEEKNIYKKMISKGNC